MHARNERDVSFIAEYKNCYNQRVVTIFLYKFGFNEVSAHQFEGSVYSQKRNKLGDKWAFVLRSAGREFYSVGIVEGWGEVQSIKTSILSYRIREVKLD